ncbi:MAG: glycosyltransferase [Patescibacteria group bacterium]
MKILQINKLYYPTIGGIEKVVQDIAEGLNGQDNIEITNLVCQEKGSRTSEEISGVKVFRAATWLMLFRMPISFDFFGLYKKLVSDCDLVILHHPFPLGFLAYRLFSPRKKVIVWYHSDIIKQKFLGSVLQPLAYSVLRLASHIFVSNNNLIKYSTQLKTLVDKCRVIPYGLKLEDFQSTDELKSQARIIADKYHQPIVLSVGRLVYYKGFEYLIRSFIDVHDAVLVIIGEGPLQAELQKIIDDNNLVNRVFLLDHQKDIRPYYFASQLFILSSVANSEAFGLVQMEAMACGLPVINTNLPTGVPEVGLDGQTGFTVEPKNSAALATSINKIIHDSVLRSRLSVAAKKRAEQVFSLGRFLETNKKYFKEVVEK